MNIFYDPLLEIGKYRELIDILKSSDRRTGKVKAPGTFGSFRSPGALGSPGSAGSLGSSDSPDSPGSPLLPSSPFIIVGPSDSQKAHIACSICEHTSQKALFITYNEAQARKMHEDFIFFLGSSAIFLPSVEIMLHDIEAKSYDALYGRLQALDRILSGDYKVVVTSVEAVSQYLSPTGVFAANSFSIAEGEGAVIEELAERLVIAGYERTADVERKGQFAIRGGILDVFVINMENPSRIEFFGDEVDSLRLFDLATQRSVGKISKLRIIPARDIVFSVARKAEIIASIRRELKNSLVWQGGAARESANAGANAGASVAAGGRMPGERAPGEYIENDIALFENRHYFPGMDRYLKHIIEKPCCAIDYFAADTLIFADEPARMALRADNLIMEHYEECKALLERRKILPSCAGVILDKEDIFRKIEAGRLICLNVLPTENSRWKGASQYSFITRQLSSYERHTDMLIEEMRRWKNEGNRVLILSGIGGRGRLLCDELKSRGIEAGYSDSADSVSQFSHGQILAVKGSLHKGFEYAEARFVVISDSWMLQQEKKGRPAGGVAAGAAMGAGAGAGAGTGVRTAGVGADTGTGAGAGTGTGVGVGKGTGDTGKGTGAGKAGGTTGTDSGGGTYGQRDAGRRGRRRGTSAGEGGSYSAAGRISTFTELAVGDHVVHYSHGIGIYEGIIQLMVDGIKRDYIKIRYLEGAYIYIPVNQLDLIQKYIGSEGRTPKLSKLGGADWAKTKSRVKESLKQLAGELVQLYATRRAARGFAFPEDTIWQRQFEDLFRYEPTDDQLQCIDEIKNDMEKPVPMDRLLCGDVGYGKTEVAVRAMFKAVLGGRQVAYLVPTTILAQQQYDSIVDRTIDFPVTTDVISRFRSRSEQKEILKGIKNGKIDILVGTHRLIQKDISFKNLGLLVIDEEHRFGVANKERIKKLKPEIDVLTLTATPIPRTLHMSLTGIRDISTIEDPPEERYPVQTYVMEYDSGVVKDAIMRELARNGQIFYLYNRVRTIQIKAAEIQEELPDARIAYAHGQMDEKELEDIMFNFIGGKYDILVCTTIIESGLDMPNVNTIIVEDADKMGLAQLYQLRGRVGRSNRLAYAYIMYKKDKVLTEASEKRLQAIREFTELGSGFKIAMRDLEIRGAGNLLGAEQHGHLDTVGYDMYCRLLDEAVHEIREAMGKQRAAAAAGGEAVYRDAAAGREAAGAAAAAGGQGTAAAAGSGSIGETAAGGGQTAAAAGKGNITTAVPDIADTCDTVVDIAVNAYLDDSYIGNAAAKIQMYRKIADIKTEQDLLDIRDEMTDRYGDMPETACNLTEVAYIKALATRCGFSAVQAPKPAKQHTSVIFNYRDGQRINFEILTRLMEKYRRQLLFSAGKTPHLSYRIDAEGVAEVLHNIKILLQDIIKLQEPSLSNIM